MNEKFQSYATRTALNISLSKNQIITLYLIKHKQFTPHMKYYGATHDTFVPSAKVLQRKGMVTYTRPIEEVSHNTPYPYALTKAGALCYLLCEEAGCYENFKEITDAERSKQSNIA